MDKATAKRLLERGVDPSIILDEILGEDSAPETAPESAEKAAPEVKPETAPDDHKEPSADPILEAINRLTGIIQAQNVRGRGIETIPAESTDDILSGFIGGNKK